MTTDERRATERDIRRQILRINNQETQDVLFSLLGLVHDLAIELEGHETACR